MTLRPILALAALAAAAFVLTVKAAGGVNRAVGRRWEWEDEPLETMEDRDWLVPGAAWVPLDECINPRCACRLTGLSSTNESYTIHGVLH